MTQFTLLPDGNILIIGKPASTEVMAEIGDRVGPTEGVVEVDAKELEDFLREISQQGDKTD